METKSMKQHMGMRAANTISNTIIHVLLVAHPLRMYRAPVPSCGVHLAGGIHPAEAVGP